MLHQDAAVGAHGERGAQRFLGPNWPDGHRDDFGGRALFLELDGLFDRDLVEGVDRHFHVGKVNARTVGFDAYGNVEIDHPFDGDEYLHWTKMPCSGPDGRPACHYPHFCAAQ